MATVKTYLRVRPEEREELLPFNVRAENGRKTFVLHGPKGATRHSFEEVFAPEVDQAGVYAHFARPMLDAALSGMNYLLMSYGQTSSGKSFTIIGDPRRPGLVPRFITDLIGHRAELEEEGQLRVQYSLFEIYKEKIYDCLEGEPKALILREQPGREVFIDGLITRTANTLEDVIGDLHAAIARRRAGETLLNGRSSRSHFVVSLDVSLTSKLGSEGGQFNVTKRSRITFVDLAGSEKQTRNFRTTFEEGCAINKSLSVLAHIVGSLSKRTSSFLHFRDSKLTHFLKDCFSGDAHVSIIANVLATREFASETLSTLAFIAAARRVRIDPHFNVESEPSDKLDAIEGCVAVRKEIAALHTLMRDEALIDHLRKLYEQHLTTRPASLSTSEYLKSTADLHAKALTVLSGLRQSLEAKRAARDAALRDIAAALERLARGIELNENQQLTSSEQVTRRSFYQPPRSKTNARNQPLASLCAPRRSCSYQQIDSESFPWEETLEEKEKEIERLQRLVESQATQADSSPKTLARKVANLERQLRNRNKDYLCAVKEIEKLKLELLAV